MDEIKIDFGTKIGDFKLQLQTQHIKPAWKNGLFDKKGLLKSLQNEVILLIEPEKEKTPDSKNTFLHKNTFIDSRHHWDHNIFIRIFQIVFKYIHPYIYF